jgi:transcriptional regulator with XRE-family HTH domain
MDLKKLFGGQVRWHRERRGMTQAQLAEETELSLDMVGRMERGLIAPSFGTIEALCRVLEAAPARLFLGDVLPNEEDERKSEALLELLRVLQDRSPEEVHKVVGIARVLFED